MNECNKLLLQFAGTVESIIGLAHFGMPYFAFESPCFSQLNPEAVDFVSLCIYAIGILLVGIGLVTTLLAPMATAPNRLLQVFTVIKASMWSARVVLEIVYPVRIPLFLIEDPSTIVMTILIANWLLLASSVILTSLTLKIERIPREESARL